jgi:hypothetical protein
MRLMTRLRRRTTSGVLTEAARLVLPKGIATTGFPAINATCQQIGIHFDPWQVDLNRCILAKTPSGLYAADTVALSIPRQVGKTFDVGGIVFADSINTPGVTTVWTAHRFKVARESFNEMRGWAKSPKLAKHIDYDQITTAAGNECIPFRNGSRIVFAARERGAIRGFTKVRRLVLDEGQILTEAALSDLVPTMNQAENPQIILMGTPPKPTDPAEVWTRIRLEALGGDSEGVLYVEIGAPPGSDPLDRDAWRKANPSYPTRTPARAILRMWKLLSVDDFRREALGIWDDDGTAVLFTRPDWVARRYDGELEYPTVFALDAALNGRSAAIGAAGEGPDGSTLVQIVEHQAGVGWLVQRCRELDAEQSVAGFVVDEASPVDIETLEDAGLNVIRFKAVDVAGAAAGFVTGIADGTIRYLQHEGLDAAIPAVRSRPYRDGGFFFGRRVSSADISPVNAAAMAARWHALYGAGEASVYSF